MITCKFPRQNPMPDFRSKIWLICQRKFVKSHIDPKLLTLVLGENNCTGLLQCCILSLILYWGRRDRRQVCKVYLNLAETWSHPVHLTLCFSLIFLLLKAINTYLMPGQGHAEVLDSSCFCYPFIIVGPQCINWIHGGATWKKWLNLRFCPNRLDPRWSLKINGMNCISLSHVLQFLSCSSIFHSPGDFWV